MEETRAKKSAKNMMTSFLYQFIMLVLSFVSRTVFINALGREYLGLNGIFSDILNLLSMADLGFNTAMAYTFYKPLAEKNEKELASLIAFYKKVYNIIATAVLILGLLCVPFLNYIIKTEKDIPHLEVYYLFSLAGVVISYMFVYKTTLLTADQKNYKIVRINIVTNLVKVILQMIVLVVTSNYIIYLAIGVIVQFINNIIASKKTEKEYPFLKDRTLITNVDKSVTSNIFSNMKSVFIYKISGTLFSATDNIIISLLLGTAMVGVYSNYLMISSKLLMVEQIVFSALTASVGNVIVKESAKKRYEVFNAMQSASFIFCGIITSVFGIMANDLIGVWLDSSYKVTVITVIAITLNTYLSCVLQPLWTYRDATGLYIKTKYVMFIGACINIILSVVLGKILGIAGILFASAIARLSTYFWYEPKLLFSIYFERKAKDYYIAVLKNIVLVFTTIGLVWLLTKKICIDSWGDLLIKGTVVGIICTVVFMAAYCRTEGFSIIYNKAKKILKR